MECATPIGPGTGKTDFEVIELPSIQPRMTTSTVSRLARLVHGLA
jgi:hypothetical protein